MGVLSLSSGNFIKMEISIAYSGRLISKLGAENETDVNNIWTTEPMICSILVYGFIVPLISILGIIGNSLILVVVRRPRRGFKTSTYTYLSVLATADLVTCSLLFFSGLAKGFFWDSTSWPQIYDAFVHLPIGTISSNMAVAAFVFVTVDRLSLVSSSGLLRCSTNKASRFCDEQMVAMKVMTCCMCFVCFFNLPHFFVFTYDDNDNLTTSKFYSSRLYVLYNWLELIMFGMIGGTFLIVANSLMCCAVRREIRQRDLSLERSPKKTRVQDQRRMTFVLIISSFLFVAGEIPTHLASRLSAVSILYGGDESKMDITFMEKFRAIATLLNALSSSANFVVYCLLSPYFLSQFKRLLSCESSQQPKMKIATVHQQIERMS